MIAVLLDQVTAYAAAVRSHLGDLGPEQVDDLTDGLEADLAEALEDEAGGAVALEGESLLDLARRFGPAREYAAELRAAAGLDPVVGGARRRPVREALRATGASWEARGARFVGRLADLPGGRWLVETVPLLRPAWWLLRGWVWFVIAIFPVSVVLGLNVGQPFVPTSLGGWVVLIALAVLSIEWGRGRLQSRRAGRVLLLGAHAVALLAVVPLLVAFASGQATPPTVYVQEPSPVTGLPAPTDGVVVDGMRVSNLFVYDAQGNELHDVQVFDDRGRPVRTVTPQDGGDWSLPGVTQQWAFAPGTDVDGRDRWNVYPLLGAPIEDWTWTDSGVRELLGGRSLAMPPSPFAKAPALQRATSDVAGGTSPTGVPTTDPSPTGTATSGSNAADTAAPAAQVPTPAAVDLASPGAGG